MKIAVITDDVKTVSEHFERAQYYLVFTVKNGVIAGQELRLKNNNAQFPGREQDFVKSEPGYSELHSTVEHASMMGTIIDCDVLLARGMDRSAYDGLKIRSIQPIITDIQDVLAAVNAYLAGDIIDHPEHLH